MEQSPKVFYEEQIGSYSLSVKKLNNIINLASFGRLAIFIILLLSIYFAVAISPVIYLLSGASVIGLALLVKYHLGLEKEKKLQKRLLEINYNEIKYLNFEIAEFRRGTKYINDEHPYSSDLNIFGTASLFQYINRTTTSFGQKILATTLGTAETRKAIISENQKAIKEFTEMPEWRQKFQAIGSFEDIRKIDLKDFYEWIEEPNKILTNKSVKFFLWFFPVAMITSILVGIFVGNYGLFKLMIILEVLYVMSKLKSINSIHEKLSEKHQILQRYSELLKMIENEDFKSSALKQAKTVLTKDEGSAAKQLKKLSSIMNSLDARLNVLVAIFLNLFYMSDLRNVIKLERWKSDNKNKINNWFEAMGKFDAFSSLSTYAFNNPGFIYPEINNDVPVIKAESLGHPLIQENKRVCNDFELSNFGKVVILTGANMAGKSTFLRTVGINMILGMAGAPVCAKQLSFRPLQLVTSISIKDSLFENESYFYAELKRLQNVIDRLNKGEKIFILLDEILKGTNSKDKLKGSKALLKQFISLNAVGVVATHDTLLGEIEKEYPNNIINHSFEVELENDRLFYDYKLRKGICQNVNASFLMKKMGIILE